LEHGLKAGYLKSWKAAAVRQPTAEENGVDTAEFTTPTSARYY
jgi:hypothetical protein